MKLKFDCVFYYVFDLERSIRFYADVLGFSLTSRDFVARFQVDGVLFELVPTADRSKLNGGGNARLCLEVEDIALESSELQRRNVSVSPAKSEQGGMLASFHDPDGNEICLWQYTDAKRDVQT